MVESSRSMCLLDAFGGDDQAQHKGWATESIPADRKTAVSYQLGGSLAQWLNCKEEHHCTIPPLKLSARNALTIGGL